MAHPIGTPLARRAAGVALVLVAVASGLLAASGGPQSEAGFLWVAQSNGLLNVATDEGAIRFELRQADGFTGLAVNDINGEVWAYGSKALQQFSRRGLPLRAVGTEPTTHGGDPADLAVDAVAGNLWLAIKRDLYRFDLQGRLEQAIVLPQDTVGLSLDRAHSRLWVALSRELHAYDLDGQGVVRVEVVPLTGAVGPAGAGVQAVRIQDLAWDANRDQLWLTLPNRLIRYDADGAPRFEVAGDFTGAISLDGAGGAWRASGRVLVHVDESGHGDSTLEPFAAFPDQAIVDVVADPGDASVWVASARRIRHYAIDGDLLHDLGPDLGDGVIRRLSRASLYADLDPPELQIEAPDSGELLDTNRPAIALGYFDPGVGVDSGSIELQQGTARLAASCETAASGAVCVPAQALPEGAVEISATVADIVGNRSPAARVAFVVDTVPPAITLTHPPADFHTNQALLIVAGAVDEPAIVEVSGARAVPDASGRFTAPVQLAEGANPIDVGATDRAGNGSRVQRNVVLDTVAPPSPELSLLAVADAGDGQVTVAGAAGSVEPGALVRVTNARTGASVTVTAAADGSFQASIGAESGDELRVIAQDRAGNASAATLAQAPAALALSIAEPLAGATVETETVLVAGVVRGTLNSGVSVNGQPATAVVAGDALHFYRSVLLQPGANTIAVAAATQDGGSLARSVAVTRSDPAVRVRLLPVTGMAPLTTTFSFVDTVGGRFRVDYDFDGNGVVDVSKTSLLATAYKYAAPGVYRPRLGIYRQNTSTGQYELMRQQAATVAVFDAAQLRQSQDLVLRSVWNRMMGALASGDVEGALTALARRSRDRYGEALGLLRPSLPQAVAEMTPIEPVELRDTYAEYAVMKVHSGQARVHLIPFVQGTDGVWHIESM